MKIDRIGFNGFALKQVTKNKPTSFGNVQSKIASITKATKEDYIQRGFTNSLLQNTSLNNYNGEPINIKSAERLIDKLIGEINKDLQSKPVVFIGDMCDWCNKFGAEFGKRAPALNTKLISNRLKESISVDFLNFMMARQGINLGLGVKQLNKTV